MKGEQDLDGEGKSIEMGSENGGTVRMELSVFDGLPVDRVSPVFSTTMHTNHNCAPMLITYRDQGKTFSDISATLDYS